MHRPEQVLRRRPVGQRRDQRGIVQRGGDASRHRPVEVHRKARVGDIPADQRLAVGQRRGKGRLQHQPLRLRIGARHQRRGGTIAELQHGEQRLDLVRRLQMQRRQLHRHHQHAGVGVGPDDMPRGAQRDHCGIAAHESDQQPLRGRQAQPRGDDLVDPRRDEAGAARDDQMGDAVQLHARRQIVDRGEGQRRCSLGIHRHPRRRTGQRVRIEAARIDRAVPSAPRQDRPTMRDTGARGHAIEQRGMARLDLGLGPADEGIVDIVRGHGRTDGAQAGVRGERHRGPSHVRRNGERQARTRRRRNGCMPHDKMAIGAFRSHRG
ncbi:hypothetical protein WR25_07700 [Diploscapter pachys]|uniref:Uncharacterized protein n=1 Tax=Diploscapter pachys TaxID=2018661 RepID=A0A2A2M301_9BILA|nr:hypothetical protein WR25_07700 [Diploscapter pachys]